MTAIHLESALDGTRFPAHTVQTTHAGRPLWVRYDLQAVASSVAREDLAKRPQSMWRYRELLPYRDAGAVVSLGETITPLIELPVLGRELGVRRLLVKDESRLPTGSFKARGMAMAITMARELGITRVAVPTAGNAGGALAAYAARAGLQATVLMPDDTPLVNQLEVPMHGAAAFVADGLISDCGRVILEGVDRVGWFDLSTLKEPYRIEGKKTMGLELAEQLGWALPGTIFYPTGGGTGLIGMWKAFDELATLGWLEDDRRPRMMSCQSDGCAPIATAFDAGERFAEPAQNAHTIASGLRVPKAVGDFMILDAVRESKGAALAVGEDTIIPWMNRVAATEGLAICPETAVCFAALERELENGTVNGDDDIVVFNTGAAQKYVEVMECELPRVDLDAVDWDRLA